MVVPGGILVGSMTLGRLEVLSGSAASATLGNISIRSSMGGNGSALVDGAGSILAHTSATMFIGTSGTGALTVQNGGQATSLSGSIASNVGSNGAVTVSGTTSRWNMNAGVVVGGTSVSAGSTGSLTIGNGGVVSCNTALVWPSGTLAINNANLTCVGTVDHRGALTMTSGTITAPTFQATNGSSITASGHIDAAFNGPGFNEFATLTLNGALDAGRSVVNGFIWANTLNVGAHALTVRSASSSRLGDVSIAGGSINSVNPSGVGFPNGDSSGYSVGIPCVADVDNGDGSGSPDGGVTIDDLLYYLVIFELGDLASDVDDGSSTGATDGGVTIEDLLYYFFSFETGDIRSDVDDGSSTGNPDRGVTIDDLLYYLQRFEAGC